MGLLSTSTHFQSSPHHTPPLPGSPEVGTTVVLSNTDLHFKPPEIEDSYQKLLPLLEISDHLNSESRRKSFCRTVSRRPNLVKDLFITVPCKVFLSWSLGRGVSTSEPLTPRRVLECVTTLLSKSRNLRWCVKSSLRSTGSKRSQRGGHTGRDQVLRQPTSSRTVVVALVVVSGGNGE